MNENCNFPIFKNKYNGKSFTTPEALTKYVGSLSKKGMTKIPENIVLIFDHDLENRIIEKYKPEKYDYTSSYSNVSLYKTSCDNVGFIKISVGAPYAVFQFENLIASGAKNFIVAGLAGAINTNLKIGDVVIIDKAIRDEGLSYHYAPPSRYAFSDNEMLKKIEDYFKNNKISYQKGTSWTTDAIFRETIEEIEYFRNEGVLTAEMEDAALYTVAKYRNVKIASIHAISDLLHGNEWDPLFCHGSTNETMDKIFDFAVQILKGE